MTNTTKTVAIVAVAFTGLTAASMLMTLNAFVTMMKERFPEIDKKTIRKAYLNFLKNALAQKYEIDINQMNDNDMDVLFLDEVRKLQNQ